jgi:hypothetical protein
MNTADKQLASVYKVLGNLAGEQVWINSTSSERWVLVSIQADIEEQIAALFAKKGFTVEAESASVLYVSNPRIK